MNRLLALLSGFALAASVLTALSAPTALAAGREFYVAPPPSGAAYDFGSGTIDDPWGSIEYGMRQLSAGDTLYLRGGTYVQRIGTPKVYAKGTPSARITVRNYPNEQPVIKGLFSMFKGGLHYWTFSGLEVTWDPATGQANETLFRMVDGIGWELTNMVIHGNHSYAAVRVMAESPGLATDWAIRDSCINTTHGSPSVASHNIYIGAGSAGVAPGSGIIERSVVFGAPDTNIKLGAGEARLPGTAGVVVRNNVLADAPQNVLVAWKSHDNTIERNLLVRPNDGNWYPNIRGFQLTGSGNRALVNGGFGADNVISNHNDSPQPIADLGGNLRLGDVAPAGRSCEALRAYAEDLGIFGPAPDTRRRAGVSRITTAVSLAETAFPNGAQNVLIARADVYADALAGSALAGHLDAPLLLSDSTELTSTTLAEIRRLKATRAYLLGGENSLSSSVRDTLEDEGLEVERVSGPDRFSTASEVAALLPPSSVAYLVEGANADPGRGWPDAVASSALAALTKQPVLLATRDGLPDATQQALKSRGVTEVVIIGGPGSVSDEVADRVADPDGDGRIDRKVRRVSGPSRYDTSAAVADQAVAAGASTARVWLVTGTNWPDALAAGAAAAHVGANLLLMHGDDARHSPATLNWLADHGSTDRALTLVGGPGSIRYAGEASLAFAYD